MVNPWGRLKTPILHDKKWLENPLHHRQGHKTGQAKKIISYFTQKWRAKLSTFCLLILIFFTNRNLLFWSHLVYLYVFCGETCSWQPRVLTDTAQIKEKASSTLKYWKCVCSLGCSTIERITQFTSYGILIFKVYFSHTYRGRPLILQRWETLSGANQ